MKMHCCNLTQAPGNNDKVKEAISLRCKSDGEKDILKESLGDNYKSIKKEALEVLYKTNIKYKIINANDLMCDTLLPIKISDEWKKAQPLTKNAKLPCPFGTVSQELEAVYRTAIGVTMNVEDSADLDAYVAQMFGKNMKEYQSEKDIITAETIKASQLRIVQLKLMQGSNLLVRDRNGTSNPYCVIGLIKKEHEDMVASARDNLVDLHQRNKLDLKSVKSGTVRNTVNPTWNENFELPINDSLYDLLVFEVWDSCCGTNVKLKDLKLSRFGWGPRDNGEGDDYMGRAFLSLSMISPDITKLTLPLYSRNRRRQYGELTVGVNILKGKPQLKGCEVIPDHNKLAEAVLDFESHVNGKCKASWDGRISSLGYKLLSQHASLNGITVLQQVSVLFSLVQKYDNKVELSVVANSGLVKAVTIHQQKLPSYGGNTLPNWAATIYSSLKNLEKLLIIVLSRHHEHAKFRTQHGIDFLIAHVQLLKELYNVAPYAKQKINAARDLTVTVKDACQDACSHLFAKDKLSSTNEVKRVSCFLAVVEFMTDQLMKCTGQVTECFQSVGVDYFTLFYQIINKELSIATQAYTTNYMKEGSPEAYYLYLKIHEILSLSSRMPESVKSSLELLEYKKWFESFAGKWVSSACDTFYDRINKATEETCKALTITDGIQISHSTFDVMVYIQQIAQFWSNFHPQEWTNHGDHLIRIIETVTHSAKCYANAAYERLKESGHNDEPNFIVTELFCIALNDIECMRIELNGMPELLNFASLELSTSTLRSLHTKLINANGEIEHYINQILSYVSKQLSNDTDPMLKELLKSGTKALDPLIKYFTAKLTDLQSKLMVPVLQSILMEMWGVIVTWSLRSTESDLTTETARHMKESLKELVAFFYCNGEGLSLDMIQTEEYKVIVEKITLLSSTNEELILLHLKTIADESQAAEKCNGELTCTLAYIQNKSYLEVNVIKGANLPVMDIGGASDPYVEVVLMPEDKIKIKAVKTKTIKANVNPYYGKEFKIKIKPALLNTPGAVLTFSIYDVNTIKSDEFMGMAAIQCKDIPQLKTLTSDIEDPQSTQRMNVVFTLVRDTKTLALGELKNRKDHYVEAFSSCH